MKKTLLALAALGLVVLTGTPLVVGLVINDPAHLAELSRQLGQPGLTLSLQRHWFSTTGTAVIEDPVIAGQQTRGTRVSTPVSLRHGLVIRTPEGLRVGLAYAQLEPRLETALGDPVLDALLAGPTTAQASLLVSLTGSLHLTVRNEALRVEDAGLTLQIDAPVLTVDVMPDRSARLALHAESVALRDPGVLLEIDGPALRLETASLDASPLPGSVQLAISRLHGLPGEDPREELTLHDIRIDYVARAVPGPEESRSTLFLQQNFRIGMLESRLPLSAIAMESVMSDVPMSVFEDAVTLLRDAQAGQATQDKAEALSLRLWQSAWSQHTEATMTVWDGEHAMDLTLQWAGLPNVRNVAEIDADQVINALTGTLDLRSNIEAVSRGPLGVMARNYARQGALAQTGSDYTLRLALQDGELLYNGERYSLEPLLTLLSLLSP